MKYRSHNCGELRKKDVGKKVILSGWVQKSRRLGKMVFVDLRDKFGITQIVFKENSAFIDKANELRNEYVIKIEGKVLERKNKNKDIDTGDIEIEPVGFDLLAKAETTPLIIADKTDALEEKRMEYRYLDLRRNPVRENIELRHKVIWSIRKFFNNDGYTEIETPILTKPTPEGARDFVVPSRLMSKNFYALPQSPQIFKQLLMIGGFEKYFQIARCFRDEDLRADRQPEFTQLDVEVSFASQKDFMTNIEMMIKKVFKDVKGIDVRLPLPQIDYEDAMKLYGTDKPDTRFDILLNDVTKFFAKSLFKVFANAKAINAILVPKILEKKQLQKLEYIAKEYGAKGLAWAHVKKEGIKSPIAKFCKKELEILVKHLNADNNTTLLFVADIKEVSQIALGAVRNEVGKMLNLISKNKFNLLWVVNWPLFEIDEDGKISSTHHPFTSPNHKTINLLEKAPLKVRASAYDMVINGNEIGGGSVRIFTKELQDKIFSILGLKEDEIKEKFGFFTDALKYGTPPHCGIALGIDRLVMLLSKNAKNIKDVIAFPKNSSGFDTMTKTPTSIKKDILQDLKLKVGK